MGRQSGGKLKVLSNVVGAIENVIALLLLDEENYSPVLLGIIFMLEPVFRDTLLVFAELTPVKWDDCVCAAVCESLQWVLFASFAQEDSEEPLGKVASAWTIFGAIAAVQTLLSVVIFCTDKVAATHEQERRRAVRNSLEILQHSVQTEISQGIAGLLLLTFDEDTYMRSRGFELLIAINISLLPFAIDQQAINISESKIDEAIDESVTPEDPDEREAEVAQMLRMMLRHSPAALIALIIGFVIQVMIYIGVINFLASGGYTNGWEQGYSICMVIVHTCVLPVYGGIVCATCVNNSCYGEAASASAAPWLIRYLGEPQPDERAGQPEPDVPASPDAATIGSRVSL